jgi:hypothetical protein
MLTHVERADNYVFEKFNLETDNLIFHTLAFFFVIEIYDVCETPQYMFKNLKLRIFHFCDKRFLLS